MCILFAYINPNPKPGGFKVVLASNRDEILSRPSQPAHEWSAYRGVYGGLDMQPGKEGGTWLGINKYGRIGVLLNIAQGGGLNPSAEQTSQRGFYVVEWMTNMKQDMKGVFDIIKEKHGECPRSFRMVAFDITGEPKIGTLTYSPSTQERITFEEEFLSPGIYALGNNAPGFTWNKVMRGRERFEAIVNEASCWTEKQALVDNLLELLGSKELHWPDEAILSQMDRDPEILKRLSSIFVDIPGFYGTRTHSIILVNSENQVLFYERSMDGQLAGSVPTWLENVHEFHLEPSDAQIKSGTTTDSSLRTGNASKY